MRSAAGTEVGDLTETDESAPELLLPWDDARALRRFVRWSLGAGFKLCVVGVAGRHRDRLLRWALRTVAGARQVRLDRANEAPIRDVIQEAIGTQGELSLLVLTHLEAAVDRRRVCAQLNVQRDELVVAFAVPWLVLVSPQAALALQQDAPDFSDFVGLWLAEREEKEDTRPASFDDESPLMEAVSRATLGGPGAVALQGAILAANEGRFEQARDLLAQHDLVSPGAADSHSSLLVRGDVFRVYGDSGAARRCFEHSLDVALRLADAEPTRAEFQRDISTSLERLADLCRALGNGTEARRLYERSLDIRMRLANAEPARAHLQRDLSISLERLGDLHRALGNGAEARRLLEQSLDIRTRLSTADPARADFQRNLCVSFNKLGDLHRALGNVAEARRLFGQSLDLAQRLADAAPARADFQRDLSISYDRLGDLHADVGNVAEARRLFERSLDIRTRLVDADPLRADLQRDLSVSLNRLGDLHLALGNDALARPFFDRALDIRTRLAANEPARADFQRDLSSSFERLARVDPANPEWLDGAVATRRRVLALAPELAHAQRELAATLAQRGEARDNEQDLQEALELLRSLRDEGRLEARFAPLLVHVTALLAD